MCFLFLKELAKGIKLKKSFGFEINPRSFDLTIKRVAMGSFLPHYTTNIFLVRLSCDVFTARH